MKESKCIEVGALFHSNNSGIFEIINIINSRKIEIKFVSTGSVKLVDSRNIRKGVVKDDSLIYSGCGAIMDCTGEVGANKTKEYTLWAGMLNRCYSEKYHKKRPRYLDCEVSPYFKIFSNFKYWCSNQVGFNCTGFDLDKDLLVKGNRIYSETTCCFIPQEINKALQKTNKLRGDLPIGVCLDKSRGKYTSKIKLYGKIKNLGRFDTIGGAFTVYKVAKENHLKCLADKWKGSISVEAYNALIGYSVDFDD